MHWLRFRKHGVLVVHLTRTRWSLYVYVSHYAIPEITLMVALRLLCHARFRLFVLICIIRAMVRFGANDASILHHWTFSLRQSAIPVASASWRSKTGFTALNSSVVVVINDNPRHPHQDTSHMNAWPPRTGAVSDPAAHAGANRIRLLAFRGGEKGGLCLMTLERSPPRLASVRPFFKTNSCKVQLTQPRFRVLVFNAGWRAANSQMYRSNAMALNST